MSKHYEKLTVQEKTSIKVEKEEHFGSTGVKGLEVKEWVQWAKNTQAGRREGGAQNGGFVNN